MPTFLGFLEDMLSNESDSRDSIDARVCGVDESLRRRFCGVKRDVKVDCGVEKMRCITSRGNRSNSRAGPGKAETRVPRVDDQ